MKLNESNTTLLLIAAVSVVRDDDGAIPGSGFKALSASVVLPEPTSQGLTFLALGGLLRCRPRRD